MRAMPDFEVHSGTGEKNIDIKVDLDPAVVAGVLSNHPVSHEDQRFAEVMGQSTHLLSIDVSGLTLAELHTRLGSTEFLPSLNVSLVPGDVKNELQGQVHADIIKQAWTQIGGVGIASGLGTELDYQHSTGASAKVDVNNEVKFKDATLTITLTTDLSGPQPKVEGTVGLKFSL
jgi:hypothetical protein